MTTFYDLSKAAVDRSTALSAVIREEIEQANACLSFSRFMELALYHPSLGYYTADTFTLGAKGDFTTAPEISPLFAQCFARQTQQIFTQLETKTILELGAGTGRFAHDLIKALQGELDHYYIYEISENLRKKQQQYLKTACPEFFERMTWLEKIPADFTGVIIANEVLDALPVHCFQYENNNVNERCVTWHDDHFEWALKQATPSLNEAVRALPIFTSPYRSEIALSLPTFMQALAEGLTKGVILFADYGYGQSEYYHPARKEGTLTCFYQHQKQDNPLLFPGLQDITAHVNFTQVIENASLYSCQLAGYTSQAGFLLNTGLIELTALAEKNLSVAEAVNLHHGIKVLTFPSEMGERVKVMALSKAFDLPLIGFTSQDRRRDL